MTQVIDELEKARVEQAIKQAAWVSAGSFLLCFPAMWCGDYFWIALAMPFVGGMCWMMCCWGLGILTIIVGCTRETQNDVFERFTGFPTLRLNPNRPLWQLTAAFVGWWFAFIPLVILVIKYFRSAGRD